MKKQVHPLGAETPTHIREAEMEHLQQIERERRLSSADEKTPLERHRIAEHKGLTESSDAPWVRCVYVYAHLLRVTFRHQWGTF
jgi:hypothetical protein